MAKVENGKIFAQQVSKLIEQSGMIEEIERLAEMAYNSGALDTDKIIVDDFSYPKVVLCAVLKSMSFQYAPLSDNLKDDLENLSRFV